MWTILLLAASAFASPTKPGQTFSLTQVAVKGPRLSGAQHLLKAYQKHATHIPDQIIKAALAPSPTVAAIAAPFPTGTGSVGNTPVDQFDTYYLVPLKAGNQIFHVDVDTGSCDLWLFSNFLPANQRGAHTLYNPSSSAKLLESYNWSMSYADHSGGSGIVYADTVVVGGVTVTSMAVEAATSISAAFIDSAIDGLLAMSWGSSLNTVKPISQDNFFDMALSQYQLRSNVFTASLNYKVPGSFDFGYIDSKKYIGQIKYVTADIHLGLWGTTISSYAVNFGVQTPTNYSAILDTGTTLLYLPSSLTSDYYKHVKNAIYDDNYREAQNVWTVPCSATLPNLELKIGSFVADIPGKYLMWAPLQSNTSRCLGALQKSDGFGYAVLGDPFFNAVFVVFEMMSAYNSMIGFGIPTYNH